MGAKAMIGTALTATAKGVSVSLADLKAVTASAAATPTTTPAASPVTTMKPVTRVAVMIVSMLDTAALTISVGGGSTKPSGRTRARAISHPPKMTSVATAGGSQARTSRLAAVASGIATARHLPSRRCAPRSRSRRTRDRRAPSRCARRGRCRSLR